MWQPPERIVHPLPQATWPSAEQAERSMLFRPIRIGRLEVLQRTWVPAMVPWRASEDGHVTPEVIAWYRRFAEGRPGVIVVEATGIRDIPSGPLLRIGHDRFLPGLQELVRAVHEASDGATRLFIQIIDFLPIRRRPAAETYFARYLELRLAHRQALEQRTGRSFATASEAELRAALLALGPTGWPEVLDPRELEALEYGYRERVWDTHLPHIRELPRVLPGLFADAAQRAFAAGFDGVELHYAHAYTMASFLSALNHRSDGYGGNRDNRVRLPLEVLAAVRQRVGQDRVVGLRFLGEEAVPGGSTIDDAIFYALAFCRTGVDFLSLSRGGKFEDARQPRVGEAAYPYTGPSGYQCMPTIYSDQRGPFGRNLHLAAAIRTALRAAEYGVPVVGAGGLCDFAQCEQALVRGEIDIVAAARQTLADPDWFLKMRLGRGAEIRRCHYTNYCEGLDQKHKQVTCKLWDRTELDAPDVMLDPSGKRRLTAPPWRP
jgi:2,4-dienoyl-CoA reductase-like NADH-dependent reductase (Old Yellow Enzyme family)